MSKKNIKNIIESSVCIKNNFFYKKIKINFYPEKIFSTTFFLSGNSVIYWDDSGNVLSENIKFIRLNNKKIYNNSNINNIIKINKKNSIKIILNDYRSSDIRINYDIDYFYYKALPNKKISYDKITIYGKDIK